jgi:DNA-binding MarR family transcriptional regulator
VSATEELDGSSFETFEFSEGRLSRFLDHLADAWAQIIPDFDRQTLALFGFLDAISRTWETAQADTLDKFGLNYAEFLTLGNLRTSPPGVLRSPTELRQLVRQTSAGMARVLSKLEALGYVRRQPHAEDRRSSVMLLTPKGRAAVDRAFRALHERQRELLAPLSPHDRPILAGSLGQLHAALVLDRVQVARPRGASRAVNVER